MTEHYKLISDMNELKWYFDHIIAKPNYDEAYAFCMSSRHKKLTKEEAQAKAKGWKNSYSPAARKYYGVRYRIVEVK